MKARKKPPKTDEITPAKTGIAGPDEGLHGGLTAGSLDLIEGTAGTGKTTRGLQFALEGVSTFPVMGQTGVVGDNLPPAHASYLADGILPLRLFEAAGEVHKALSVVKKHSGSHETSIRELKFGPDGIGRGEALRPFPGILGGEPTFTGPPNELMQAEDDQGR